MTLVAPRSVLCFGDSNTHGTLAMHARGDLGRLPWHLRWPGVVSRALGEGWNVIEEGQPGRTTVHDDPVEGAHKNGLRALPVLLETHRPIDVVILMLGTNDLKARFSVTHNDIAPSIERLVSVVRTSHAGPDGRPPDVMIVAPVPVVEAGWLGGIFAGAAEKSSMLSHALEGLAARLGLSFVDAGTLAEVDPVDGVHITAEGHEAIGRAIAARIAVRES